jgi:hypothetical protein
MSAVARTPTALLPVATIGDGHLAGEYFWYSIEEAMVSLRKLRVAFTENGLDATRLPAERRPEHVAQEACRKVARVTSNGHREEIRVEQIDRNPDALVYQITQHAQDRANRVIRQPLALRVLFHFETAELSFETLWLDGATPADVQELIDEITAHFTAGQTQIPGRKLRTIVRHYVEEAGAENVRGPSGGVYFIAKHNPIPTWSKLCEHHGASIDGSVFIQQIRMMLEDVYGAAPNFHAIPCVDDEAQREFLKRKLIENCSEDLESYRNECVALVRGKDSRARGFRADRTATMVNRRKEIEMRCQKFAALLREPLQELEGDMALADRALTELLQEASMSPLNQPSKE